MNLYLQVKVIVSNWKNVLHAPLMRNGKTWTLHFHSYVLSLSWLALSNLTLVLCLMSLFSSPQYWCIFDESLVCSSSSVDTGHGGEKEKNQGQSEIKDMKVLSPRLRMTQVLSRSQFPFLLKWRQNPFLYDMIFNYAANFFNLKNNVYNMIDNSRGYAWRKIKH